jgi:HEAT repeat protein
MHTLTLLVSLLLASTANLAVPESGRVAWKVPTRNHAHWNSCCRTCNEVTIAVTMKQGKIEDLDLHDCECETRGEKARLLGDVDPSSSIDFLLAHLREEPREIVTAIALHDHPRVVNELITLARNDRDRDVRRHSLFWLGQRAGEKATAELRRAVDEDPDDDVRQHAVFAISQLPKERSVPILIDLAKHHKSRGVRKKAMFWLAQTNDPRAVDLFEEILLR